MTPPSSTPASTAATTHDYARELNHALQTVYLASHLTKSVLRSLNNAVSAETKADSSPVTIADFAAQAIIISSLHAAFPDDLFVGEESAEQLRQDDDLAVRVWELVERARVILDSISRSTALSSLTGEEGRGAEEGKAVDIHLPADKAEMLSTIDLGGTTTQTRSGRVWVLDPVDGTATFMQGKQYAVALCLLVDGVQEVGVIACPNLAFDIDEEAAASAGKKEKQQRIHEDLVDRESYGVVLSAVRGRGTYVRRMHAIENGSSKQLRDLNFVESAIGSTSLSQGEHRDVAELLGVPVSSNWPGTTVWSQQLKYVALALGASDVMVRIPKNKERFTYLWDHAGGQILFQEAGGVIRDFDGGDIDLGNGRKILGERNYGMVAAMPWAFDEVDRTVKEVLARRTA
ncbi:carbohydrate phosphatase [Aaosphaeria arxii CBS 175.79]|uniref:Carbohydrate phosphatase n=1 Tax=Aaosphaeria arxii CBS 175.79 TaxID=1450172 RepID=A0A6A5XLA9_9PLEO|nr:carbohydrate phosphatase [Aaosphaeria arxii CBS 175.79]KAF2013676.1 carbohydrate phosphatase [Aaosphaeria arxii CBS 175.79]